jgi:hypothetical protein
MKGQGNGFTAAEIARAIGCSKQNIHTQLSRVPSSGEKVANGNLAKIWNLDCLPSALIHQLAQKATAKGYRTISRLLLEPFTRFELPLSLTEIAPAALERARKLRSALRETIPLRNDTTVIAAELAARGLSAYKREFCYAVTAKHWRALFDRTVERDNGAEEWERLELYVEENPPRISSPAAASCARERDLPVLEDALTALQGVNTLGVQQLIYLWTKSCDQLQESIEAKRPSKQAKRQILQVLLKSGLVGKDIESIRRAFDRKWTAYLTNRGMLRDGRTVRYAQRCEPISEQDKQTLIARGLDCGGRVSQAFRETFQGGELSPELTDRFIANPKSKSYVPRSIRSAVTADIKRLMPLHRGPREHELRGAYNRRDFSGMCAGDSFQADDCTCPVVYFEPDSSSRSGFRFLRGQLVLMIDERSLLALGFALHSENNYNARIIRALITRVHDSYGLPRRRFYFERGIWKSARILTGDHGPALALEHTEMGLRDFGVKFAHAKLPRGKVIERVLGLVQNRMERVPGYVGRDERNDRFERVQEQLREARSGGVPPGRYFLSKDQWITTLAKLLDEYNAERQDGKLLAGQSPREVWNRCQSNEGLVQLGEKARYLLAHHKLKLRVRRDGLTLRPSLGGGTYCNAITGRFVGQDVLVWCNPEELDYIAVTSLDRKQGPFVVPRLEPLPAIDASPQQLQRNTEQIGEHNGYAKTAYRLVSPHLVSHTFRKLMADTTTLQVNEELEAGVRSVKHRQDQLRSSARRVRALSRELKFQPPANLTPATLERTAHGFDMMAEARQLRAAQKKSYVLEAPEQPLSPKQRNGMYWRLLKEAKAAQPGLNPFAVITHALGGVKKIAEMSDTEFRKVCHIFESIAKKQNCAEKNV